MVGEHGCRPADGSKGNGLLLNFKVHSSAGCVTGPLPGVLCYNPHVPRESIARAPPIGNRRGGRNLCRGMNLPLAPGPPRAANHRPNLGTSREPAYPNGYTAPATFAG